MLSGAGTYYVVMPDALVDSAAQYMEGTALCLPVIGSGTYQNNWNSQSNFCVDVPIHIQINSIEAEKWQYCAIPEKLPSRLY